MTLVARTASMWLPLVTLVAETQDILYIEALASSNGDANDSLHGSASVIAAPRATAGIVTTTSRPPILHNATATAVDAPRRQNSRLTKELTAQVRYNISAETRSRSGDDVRLTSSFLFHLYCSFSAACAGRCRMSTSRL